MRATNQASTPESIRTEPAKVLWLASIPLLGVPLTAASSARLEAYVLETLRWRAAEEALAAEGQVLTLRNIRGEVLKVMANPQLAIGAAAHKRASELAALLRLKSR